MVQEQLVNENGQINIGTHSAIRWDKKAEAKPKETAQTAAIILHCPRSPYLCLKTQLSFMLGKGNQTQLSGVGYTLQKAGKQRYPQSKASEASCQLAEWLDTFIFLEK